MDLPTGVNEIERRRDTLDAVDVDALFGVLADARRRRALACLAERDGPTTLAELADAVAARESDAGRAGDGGHMTDGGNHALDGEHEPDASMDAGDVRVSLYHVHLPKMADAGVVEYTGDSTVRLSEVGERLLDVSALTST